MRIIRLILEGNKRLSLSSIQKLEWTPDSSYQMILGTNGSGKSSLMAELSPLPATPGDYLKGGQKQIEIEHDQSVYVLTSSFTSATRHSFKKDGQELNEGGTTAIQKELVLSHFRYTKELHELLIGNLLFTEMSVGERRKWVTRLSQNDYTYALKLFDTYKTSTRDVNGHLKHVRRRLMDETSNLQQMGDQGNLDERVEELQALLSELLLHRSPSTIALESVQSSLQRAVSDLEAAGAQVEQHASTISMEGKERSLEAIESVLQTIDRDIALNDDRLKHLHGEFEDLQSYFKAFQSEETKDKNALVEEQARLSSDAEALNSETWSFPVLKSSMDTETLIGLTREALPQAISLFTQLPDNSDQHISRSRVEEAKRIKDEAEKALNQCNASIQSMCNRLHVIEHARVEECPKCKHAWTPGIHPQEASSLHKRIDETKQSMDQCQARIEETAKYLEEADAYMALYRQWRGLIHQNPRLQGLWEWIQDKGYVTNQPAEHLDIFYIWEDEVQRANELAKIHERLNEIAKLITLLEKSEGQRLEERKQSIEKELTERTDRQASLLAWKREQRKRWEQFKLLDDASQRWNLCVERLSDVYDQALESLANRCLEKDITLTQGQLGALQHTLNNRRVLEGVVKELDKELRSSERDHEVYALLAKAMSPKEGLIAEQLHGFITCLVAQINSILSPVWTYELEVQPCGMEKGELDYQFPLHCGANGPRPKDISLGSKSLKEMINFAFAQTALLYMGLEGYPLFADELGASFDEAHRPSIHQFISRLMESQRYSQVFLISHYTAGWGSFNDAQYLVLDDRNITVPSVYNDHVTIQ